MSVLQKVMKCTGIYIQIQINSPFLYPHFLIPKSLHAENMRVLDENQLCVTLRNHNARQIARLFQ